MTPASESTSAGRPPSLLVVGSVAFDRNERDGRVDQRLGGAITYAGLTAANLGCRVAGWCALPAAVVERVAGRLDRIDLYVSPSPHATRFVNREAAGSERGQSCPERARPLRWEDRPFSRRVRWDWCHLGPLHPDDFDAAVATGLRDQSGVLSLDVQGFTRAIEDDGRVVERAADGLVRRLDRLDWVKASAAEWRVVATSLGLEPAEALRRFGWQGLLVTAGERGGTLYAGDGTFPWSAEPVLRVEWETGAGDVFVAAFVARHWVESRSASAADASPAERALAEAARISARHVAGDWLDRDELVLAT